MGKSISGQINSMEEGMDAAKFSAQNETKKEAKRLMTASGPLTAPVPLENAPGLLSCSSDGDCINYRAPSSVGIVP